MGNPYQGMSQGGVTEARRELVTFAKLLKTAKATGMNARGVMAQMRIDENRYKYLFEFLSKKFVLPVLPGAPKTNKRTHKPWGVRREDGEYVYDGKGVIGYLQSCQEASSLVEESLFFTEDDAECPLVQFIVVWMEHCSEKPIGSRSFQTVAKATGLKVGDVKRSYQTVINKLKALEEDGEDVPLFPRLRNVRAKVSENDWVSIEEALKASDE